MISRRKFLKGLLGTILAGLFAATYGFFIEPALRLRVKRWRIARKDWTAPPLKIAMISDIHLGEPLVTLRRLRKVVARTNAIGADIILLGGDFAAGHRFVSAPVPFDQAAQELANLKAPLGVFSVLGNHDWWDDVAAQARGGYPNIYADALKAVGIPVLSNEARLFEGAGFWLAGLEDQWAMLRGQQGLVGLDDLPGTLAQVTSDAPVVLLAHEPDILPKVPDRVSLVLSGHTHGGQVRLFGYSPVVPSRFGNRFAYGHVNEGGPDLVVSGGIGCSVLPVRFGVVPEITVIEIQGTA